MQTAHLCFAFFDFNVYATDSVELDLKIILGASDLLDEAPLLPTVERGVERIFVHER